MNKLSLFPPPVVALLLLGGAYVGRNSLNLEVVPASNLGFAWVAVGLALSASAAWHFYRARTSMLPHGTPTQLVTLGANLWTRNPMYLGLFTALIGVAVYEGSLAFWLVPPAFFYIINRWHIVHEESRLDELFGRDYRSYLERVRRWL